MRTIKTQIWKLAYLRKKAARRNVKIYKVRGADRWFISDSGTNLLIDMCENLGAVDKCLNRYKTKSEMTPKEVLYHCSWKRRVA